MTETLLSPQLNKDFDPATDITLERLVGALRAPETGNTPPSVLSAQERAEYLAMLNGEQPAPIPDEQAGRMLDALWAIALAFVDLGFGLGKPSTCGQPAGKSAAKCDSAARDGVDCMHQGTDRNEQTAAIARAEKGRES